MLFDMDHSAATYAVADALAERYEKLVLLTPRTQIARNVNYCSAIGIHRRLYQADAADHRGGRAGLVPKTAC